MATALTGILEAHEGEVLAQWLASLKATGATAGGRIKEGELQTQCRDFLSALRQALVTDQDGQIDVQSAGFERVRDLLGEVSHGRATQGFSPSETATFVFSLKQPLFERLRRQHAK